MKITAQISLTLFLVAMLATSCGSTKSVYIDQLKPPTAGLESSIQTLAISSNATAKGALEKTHNISNADILNQLVTQVANTNALQSLVLVDAERVSGSKLNTPLPNDTAIAIFNRMGTDAYVNIYGIIHELQLTPENDFYVTTYILASLYTQGRKKTPLNITVKDSTYAPNFSNLTYYDYDLEAFKEYYLTNLSNQFAGKIVPNWQSIERSLYNGSGLKEGVNYFLNDNLENAITSWTSTYEDNKSDKVQFKAALNIALAYETLGDIPRAKEWTEKAMTKAFIIDNTSFDSFEKLALHKAKAQHIYQAYIYSIHLEKRGVELEKLDRLLKN